MSSVYVLVSFQPATSFYSIAFLYSSAMPSAFRELFLLLLSPYFVTGLDGHMPGKLPDARLIAKG